MAKGKKNRSHAAGKSKDEFERKRDERARRNALKKEREVKEYLENDENFVSFSNQLQAVGYKIKDIRGDGNCLFRALADQLEGDDSGHLRVRKIITRYLQDHREEFEPFVEDNKSFDAHVQELSKPGTFGGNDSIVAFSRKHGVNVVIHQLNEPCWVIQGSQYSQPSSGVKELHISYHNGDHYSSLRRIGDPDNGPAWEYNNRQTKVKDDNDLCKVNEKKKTKTMEQEVSYEGAEAFTESSDTVTIVKAATGCEDCVLITQTLIDTNYDMDSTISYILQLQSVIDMDDTVSLQSTATSSLEKLNNEGGNTGGQLSDNKVPNESKVASQETRLSPVPGNDLTAPKKPPPSSSTSKGARPKVKQQQHLSNSKRKQLAKQEKKVRRMEERREEAQRNHHAQYEVEQNIEITGDLEALAI